MHHPLYNTCRLRV